VPIGCAVVVYDFGGGTFDVSVVQRRADGGWQVLAADGLTDVGGVDLDDVVVSQVAEAFAHAEPAAWRRLSEPATPAERRYRRMLLDDAREAKEQLSMAPTAPIHVPLLDAETFVTRAEFEERARPWLDRTVALTVAVLSGAGIPAGRIAGVFLVGGASRIPLVATLLHRRLGIAPTVIEQPELVVAQGALHAADLTEVAPAPAAAPGGSTGAAPEPVAPPDPATAAGAAPPPGAPDILPPAPMVVEPPAVPAPAARPAGLPRTGRAVPIVLSIAALVIVVVLVVSLVNLAGDGSPGDVGGPSSGPSPSCSQPDTFLERAGNDDMFCTASLKQFAQPWLGDTRCTVPTHEDLFLEIVTCSELNWTVTFATCASGKHNCPDTLDLVKADGATITSTTRYQAAQGISGNRLVGHTKAGVPFVYWDSDQSAASGELQSKVINGAVAVKEADLVGVWQRFTS
jgi:hypothetical protein